MKYKLPIINVFEPYEVKVIPKGTEGGLYESKIDLHGAIYFSVLFIYTTVVISLFVYLIWFLFGGPPYFLITFGVFCLLNYLAEATSKYIGMASIYLRSCTLKQKVLSMGAMKQILLLLTVLLLTKFLIELFIVILNVMSNWTFTWTVLTLTLSTSITRYFYIETRLNHNEHEVIKENENN